MRLSTIIACLLAVGAFAQAARPKLQEGAAAAARPHVLTLEACVDAVPGLVRNMRVRPANASLTVQWREPLGDACVDHYDMMVSERLPGSSPRAAPPPPPLTVRSDGYSMTVDNLKPQQEYEVRVFAVNAAKGRGPPAIVRARTKSSGDCEARAPAPVTDFRASQVGATLRLGWQPSDAGGCPSSYQVEAFDASNKLVLAAPTVRPQAVLANVQGGSKYTFVIIPANRAGSGGATHVMVSTRAPQARGGRGAAAGGR